MMVIILSAGIAGELKRWRLRFVNAATDITEKKWWHLYIRICTNNLGLPKEKWYQQREEISDFEVKFNGFIQARNLDLMTINKEKEFSKHECF